MTQKTNTSAEQAEDTRETLKRVARRLFVERGIDDVSVRDIVQAAGQRNIGAIAYYFESKEGLTRELLVDGAKVIDERRNLMLDEIERSGKPVLLRDIISVFVRSTMDVGGDSAGELYVRFVSLFLYNHREIFLTTIGGQWDTGFWRCTAHIRRILSKYPEDLLTERIVFLMLMIASSLLMREVTLERKKTRKQRKIFGGRIWESPQAIENLIDAGEGLLLHPFSSHTIGRREK